jgi:SAM-dependent methyltransferase
MPLILLSSGERWFLSVTCIDKTSGPGAGSRKPGEGREDGGKALSQDRLEIEFGKYARWLADAIERLDPADRIPAACRGTADPDLFALMADAIGARPGMRVLDIGCGLGGPGAWLERERGCSVIGVDIMEASVRGLTAVFPTLSALAADSSHLPFRDRSFHSVWALGVLETIENKRATLAETARVLVPGGRAAVFSFVANGTLDSVPLANRFVAAEDLLNEARAAGLAVSSARPLPGRPDTPPSWRPSVALVREEIARMHSNDPSFEAVAGELGKIGRLCSSGDVEAWQIVLVR